jgi:hypothetical protein
MNWSNMSKVNKLFLIMADAKVSKVNKLFLIMADAKVTLWRTWLVYFSRGQLHSYWICR